MKKLVSKFTCPGEYDGKPCGKDVSVFVTETHGLVEHPLPSCKEHATLDFNGYKNFVIAKRQPERKLFSVAIEVLNGQGDIASCETIEMHGVSPNEVRRNFMRGETRRVRIVGIAPTLGFFVHDDHGEKLST